MHSLEVQEAWPVSTTPPKSDFHEVTCAASSPEQQDTAALQHGVTKSYTELRQIWCITAPINSPVLALILAPHLPN